MTLSDCNSIDTCKNVLLSKFSNYKKPYSFNLIVNRGFNSFKFESRIFINSSSVITWSSASHKPVIQLEKNSANLKSSDLYFQSSDSQNMLKNRRTQNLIVFNFHSVEKNPPAYILSCTNALYIDYSKQIACNYNILAHNQSDLDMKLDVFSGSNLPIKLIRKLFKCVLLRHCFNG